MSARASTVTLRAPRAADRTRVAKMVEAYVKAFGDSLESGS